MPKRILQKLGIVKKSSTPDKGRLVKVDLDELGPGAGEGFSSAVSQATGIPFYEGHVEHGYSLDAVSTADECPRCHAPTRRYYGNWIYATQVAPRVAMAPAGYFCTRCPTVIIDEDLIKKAVKRRFQFRGVLGLDYEGRQDPDLFRTWNGQDAIYLFDENQTPMGLATHPSAGARPSSGTRRETRKPDRSDKPSRKGKRRRKRR